MNVTIFGPNLRDQRKGTFHVHKTGCGHCKSYGPGTKIGGDDTGWNIQADSQLDVARDVYPPGDFEWDGSFEESGPYINDFHFAPCVRSLPLVVLEGKPATVEITPAKGKRTRPRRKGLKFAIQWIANNDEPEDLDATNIEGYISVGLVADIYGKSPHDIASAIVRYRLNNR